MSIKVLQPQTRGQESDIELTSVGTNFADTLISSLWSLELRDNFRQSIIQE